MVKSLVRSLTTRQITYPWRRFWCVRGGTIDLSDHGFMLDPESDFWILGRPKPSTLEEVSNYRALILLGEPGIGKSTALEQEVVRLAQGNPHTAGAIRVDLRAFSSEDLLYRRVFESLAFQHWARGTSHLVLHLDSLDEALLRIDSIANLLADELPHHPTERLSIRIACRTAVWPVQTLEPALKQIWGDRAVGAFELAPLRRSDVLSAASLYGVDSAGFIRAVFEADVVPLAIKPLTLNMLLSIYKQDAKLPDSNGELYRRGCLVLCEDLNASRRDSRRLGNLTAPQRLCVAGRIAGTTMLANRYAIYTGAESSEALPEDVRVSALTGETEDVNSSPFEVLDAHIREVLDTGLFSARGPEQMGWAHQGYAEFLAAEYLVEKAVLPVTVLKLLRHPDGGLIPQLYAVAAWMASLSPTIRDVLIEIEPLVLLRGDLSRWCDEERGALAAAFLKALDEQRVTDFQLNIASLYPRLANSGLPGLLRGYIIDSGKTIMSRRAAIMIAEACALTALEADLLALAMNVAEEHSLRARAVAALRTCAPETIHPLLVTLAKGATDTDEDPHDELRGHSLQLLWPKHLSAADLFACIVRPNEGFTGSYKIFLYSLPESLEVHDLPVALTWARSYIASVDHIGVFTFNSLADGILVRAWSHIEDDAILNGVVAYIRECVARGGELFRGTDQTKRDQFLVTLKSQAEPRRRFLRALASERLERIQLYPFRRDSFIQADDLEWMLQAAPGGDGVDASLDEETLCNLVENAYVQGNDRQFEQLQSAAQRWPLLYSRYRFLFEGVPIDSPEAQAAKEQHQMMRTFRQPKPLLSPPPADRVADALAQFEAGNWRAFWWLNLYLTLTPTSQYYGSDLQFDITTLPGWLEADAMTRERIVKAAERYLQIGKTSVLSWIGSNQCNHNDFAAFRALLLLRKHSSEAYDRLAPEIWRKWAPAIAALPRTDNDRLSDERAVVVEALEQAPAEFTAAIRKTIRCERRDAAATADHPKQGIRFWHLQGMKFCWRHPAIREVIFSELKDAPNTDDEFAVLAEILISEGYIPARDYVLGRLQSGALGNGAAVVAVNILLAHSVPESWSVVRSLLHDDDEFARSVFLSRAQQYTFRGDALVSLPERELAELHVRMERLFPRKNDPVHKGGKTHAVGPLERIAHLRDNLLGQLVGRGSPEAVSALRWTVVQLPELQWLPFRLREAEQLMRIRTWAPLSVADVRRVTNNTRAQLVQVPGDLADVIVESLRRYQDELHGEQAPVRGLWDRQASTSAFRPVEEDAISDHVKLFLQRDLARSAIVVNREVEVSRVPGAPIGTRTDIRVQAIRREEGSNVLDTITAVIETKGCWNSALFSSLKSQLHDDYMARLGAPVGIYLVGWFDKGKWDPTDSRRSKVPNMDMGEAQKRLSSQAATLTAGSDVRAVVLDCHLPGQSPSGRKKSKRANPSSAE